MMNSSAHLGLGLGLGLGLDPGPVPTSAWARASNSSGAGVSPSPPPPAPGPLPVATLAACAALLAPACCLGAYGNCLALGSLLPPGPRPRALARADPLALSLALGDLFLCAVAAPGFALLLLLRPLAGAPGPPAGLCAALRLASAGCVLASLHSAAAIALQRLRLVRGPRPGARLGPPGSALLLALLLWAGGLALAALATRAPAPALARPRLCLPLAGPAASNDDDQDHRDDPDDHGHGRAARALYAADLLGCVAVVAVSYALIARALRRNARARRGGVPGAHGCVQAQSPPPGAHGGSCIRTRTRTPSPGPALAARDSQAVLTCVAIAASALLCCLPLAVALLQGLLAAGRSPLEPLGFALVLLKSGLDPFIYARNSAGLRRRLLWALQLLGPGWACRRHKTRVRALGQGGLEANRNKASHHDTNSAYVLSPRAQRKGVDQACGPSQAGEPGMGSPQGTAGHPRRLGSSPVHTRVEPCYSVYSSSSPAPGVRGSRHSRPGRPLAWTSSYLALHCHPTRERLPERDSTSAKQIPVPSV